MLIEFSVENFLSIKERVTLSMLASEEEGLPFNTMPSVVDEDRLLRSVVLYGANASGKSNILKAFEFMVKMVLESHRRQKGDQIEVIPFKLDAVKETQPSMFEVIFLHNGIKYLYGFSVDRMRVHDEYLYEYQNGEQILIFERENTNNFEFSRDVEEQSTLSQRTLDNRLYLSTSTEWNYATTSNIFEWFKNSVGIHIDAKQDLRLQTASAIFAGDQSSSIIKETLISSDVGMVDLNVSFVVDNPRRKGLSLLEALGGKYPFKIETKRIVTDGDGNGRTVSFLLDEESLGTQRMFELLGPWVHALRFGRLLIVDELEISLHPNLVNELVKLFHDPERNKFGAQLIFTTHNTNLLDPLLFRRDQVWFTEKDRQQGCTDLYSLYDFDHVEGEDIEKSYIVGRFGAVPLIRSGLFTAKKEDKDNA